MAKVLNSEDVNVDDLGVLEIDKERFPLDPDGVYTLTGIEAEELPPGEYNLENCNIETVSDMVMIHFCVNSQIENVQGNAVIEVADSSHIGNLRDEATIGTAKDTEVRNMFDEAAVDQVEGDSKLTGEAYGSMDWPDVEYPEDNVDKPEEFVTTDNYDMTDDTNSSVVDDTSDSIEAEGRYADEDSYDDFDPID